MAKKENTSKAKLAKVNGRTIEEMFTRDNLVSLNVSDRVRCMNIGDLKDMADAYSGKETKNEVVHELTAHDLQSLDSLWSGYNREVVANYQVGHINAAMTQTVVQPGTLAAGCCCSCTPCCCCTAAVEVDPMVATL